MFVLLKRKIGFVTSVPVPYKWMGELFDKAEPVPVSRTREEGVNC